MHTVLGGTMSVDNELVHSPRAKSGGHCIHNHLTGINVADYLGLPLRGVCAFLQEDDWCGLSVEREREKFVYGS